MKKRNLYIILILCLIISLLPVFIFWLTFGANGLSKNYSDWVSFGNFIGGTVSPIASILSLLILGWITFIVAKNSSEESFRQQIILKRTEAYHQLTTHVVKFNLFKRRLDTHIFSLKGFNQSAESKDLVNAIMVIQDNFTTLHEFYQFIFNFNLCYGYLFKYDFSSKEFKKLLASAKEFKEYAEKLEKSIVSANHEEFDNVKDPQEFINDLTDFTNSLLEEMDLDPYL